MQGIVLIVGDDQCARQVCLRRGGCANVHGLYDWTAEAISDARGAGKQLQGGCLLSERFQECGDGLGKVNKLAGIEDVGVCSDCYKLILVYAIAENNGNGVAGCMPT